jgi:hypothetical protein
MMRHPADAAQWGHINVQYSWFADDCRNNRFAMNTNGVNLFGNQSSTRIGRTKPIANNKLFPAPSTLIHSHPAKPQLAHGLLYCQFTTFHHGFAKNKNI